MKNSLKLISTLAILGAAFLGGCKSCDDCKSASHEHSKTAKCEKCAGACKEAACAKCECK